MLADSHRKEVEKQIKEMKTTLGKKLFKRVEPYDVAMAAADELLAAGWLAEEEVDLGVHLMQQYAEELLDKEVN